MNYKDLLQRWQWGINLSRCFVTEPPVPLVVPPEDLLPLVYDDGTHSCPEAGAFSVPLLCGLHVGSWKSFQIMS